jgi:hypothetical protein
MTTPQELAEQLIAILERNGLQVRIGKAIQYGQQIDLLSETSVIGQLSVYVNNKGKSRKVLQPPALENDRAVSDSVNTAWAELTGEEETLPPRPPGPTAAASAAAPVSSRPLTNHLQKLNDIADECRLVPNGVDWDFLVQELKWIAVECGLAAPFECISSIEEWRRYSLTVEACIVIRER